VSVIIILSLATSYDEREKRKKILSSRVCGIFATIATRQINERVCVCACVFKVCPRARNNNSNNNTVKVLYEETPSAAKIEKIIHRFLRELWFI
jgi:hypothetical protein